MTSTCHKSCFNKENFSLNQNCVSSCYHKYINVLSNFTELTRKEGKKIYSDYVMKAYDLDDDDPIDKLLFPLGGNQIVNPLLPFKYIDGIRTFMSEGTFEFKHTDEYR